MRSGAISSMKYYKLILQQLWSRCDDIPYTIKTTIHTSDATYHTEQADCRSPNQSAPTTGNQRVNIVNAETSSDESCLWSEPTSLETPVQEFAARAAQLLLSFSRGVHHNKYSTAQALAAARRHALHGPGQPQDRLGRPSWESGPGGWGGPLRGGRCARPGRPVRRAAGGHTSGRPHISREWGMGGGGHGALVSTGGGHGALVSTGGGTLARGGRVRVGVVEGRGELDPDLLGPAVKTDPAR
jgi:hypothetical protein